MLQRFTSRYGIGFPLLSDVGSAVIRRFGLFNQQQKEGTTAYGVPYPGTFIVDPRGAVTHRFFEAAYQERDATSSMLLAIGGSAGGASVQVESAHLRATVAVSDRTIAPGHRFAIVFDVEPRPGMHVYAPGEHDYRPFTPFFDASPALTFHEVSWPPSREYFFAPLKERVPVYDRPFRVVHPVTLKVAEGNDLVKAGGPLAISGAISYQACDDEICYMPVQLPFRVTVDLRPLIRQ